MVRTILAVAGFVLAATMTVPPALQCPEIADALTATGWQEYRAGGINGAHRAFAAARARCPDHIESRVGLGYVALRNADLDSARMLFDRVLHAQPAHLDGLTGLGLVEWRSGRSDDARLLFVRVLQLDPARSDVQDHLASLPAPLGPPPERPVLVLPDSLVYTARVNGDRFEVREAAGWAPFYINGVNLGAALPGRFPSEFPDAATYRGWIADIAAMGANSIRVYTLHPPAFYDALAAHNRAHPERPLWLLHGVWAELPPGDDYHDRAWKVAFFDEMERVVDVLHGRADVPARPGNAAGYYTADVSRWTLGLILGREWEPYSVAEFNERNDSLKAWHGEYFRIANAPAMDVWLAEAMEHVVAYETRTYRAQRPVAYTNWPTLDPMRHPVEANVQDELTIRGIAFDRSRRGHNEDEVALGATPVETLPDFSAGYFAAFHVYPYYPDFMLHDPGYAAASSPWGRSSYFGYLSDLKRHFSGVPLVIAEYGVPASWGIAHLNPQGWHHGGHTESAMAAINVRLTREIAAAGAAGGILFSWIDEWFKHSWLEAPLERPAERNRMWWNRMNPEQHYGINALEPEPRLGGTLRARRAAWDTVAPLYAGADGSRVRAHADEAYLWLSISGPAARAEHVVVGFDIVDPATGGMRLPGTNAPRIPVGVEYVLEVSAEGARMRAAPGVSPFEVQTLPRGAARREVASSVADWPVGYFVGPYTHALRAAGAQLTTADGRFDPLLVAINRARIGADSTNYVGMGYDRGALRQGPLPDGAWERTADGSSIEVRLPWSLLAVTDPSSRHVAHGGAELVRQVEDIRIVVASQSAGQWTLWPRSGRMDDVASFTWTGWDVPRFRARRRPLYDAMRQVYKEMSQTPERKVTAR